MDYIKKFVHNFLHHHKPNGWVEDFPDSRDYKFEKYFSAEIFGAVIPESLIRTADQLPIMPFQNSILSCVHASFSFVNSFNSKFKSGNDVKLAWRYTYSQVPHYNGGTTIRDCGEVQRKQGQCINSMLPEERYWLGESAMQNSGYITNEIRENAKTYKTGGYFYIDPSDKTAMKTAIMDSPIVIGVYCNSKTWKNDVTIKWNGYRQYGHAVSIVGWSDEKNAWELADWDGAGFKWLDYSYPIFTAVTVRDLPDNNKEQYMKLIKAKDDAKVFVLLPNGEKQHIVSPQQMAEGVRQGLFKPGISIVNQSEIDAYPNTTHPMVFSL